MPFDFSESPDVLRLRQMRAAFRDGRGWCRGHYNHPPVFWIFGRERHCLIGQWVATRQSRGHVSSVGDFYRNEDGVARAMNDEAIARGSHVLMINDGARSYADIADFLDAVERRLMRGE